MKWLVILALFCVVIAHNHNENNKNKGVGIGEISIFENKCPVWIVSYNAFLLDCHLNDKSVQFNLDSVPMKSSIENGRVLLKLPNTASIPDDREYTLTATSNDRTIAVIKPPVKEIPKPTVLSELSRKQYGVKSGNVIVLNANTLYLPDFHYDGRAPDAFFWIGKGNPSSTGWKIPDENGMEKKLGKYNGKSVILKLPNDVTVKDIDYLSVWCREFSIDFGNVIIPKYINVPPSSYMPEVLDYSKFEIYPVRKHPGNTANVETSVFNGQSEPQKPQGNGQETLYQLSVPVLIGLAFLMNKMIIYS